MCRKENVDCRQPLFARPVLLEALIPKTDAPPEVRAANFKAASVMKNGKLVAN